MLEERQGWGEDGDSDDDQELAHEYLLALIDWYEAEHPSD